MSVRKPPLSLIVTAQLLLAVAVTFVIIRTVSTILVLFSEERSPKVVIGGIDPKVWASVLSGNAVEGMKSDSGKTGSVGEGLTQRAFASATHPAFAKA